MNKLISKIVGLCAGFSLAIGAGVAIAMNQTEVAPVKAEAANTCVVSMEDEATDKGWENGIAYTSWIESTKGIFTFTAKGGGNNGKYYTSDTSWRMYKGGTATISCGDSYEIDSVTSSASATWTVSEDKHSASCSFTATVKLSTVTIKYDNTGGASTMLVKNSAGYQSPFSMNFGSYGGMLFYGYESNGTDVITSGITWTVSDSDILVLDTDFADNHCWVKYGTKVGTATLTASKTGYIDVVSSITVNKGDLEQIAVSGEMTTTGYAIGSEWNPTGLAVTAIYTTGYSNDVTSKAEWSFDPATPNSVTITSVVATASYTEGGITETADSEAQTVTVFAGATYDLTKIVGFSSWTTSYGSHDLDENDFNPEVTTAATLEFTNTNKQGSGIGSTYPCIGAKTNDEISVLKFTLDDADYKISTISITFVTRYTTTYPSLYLHKGNGIASTPLDSLTMSGTAGHEDTLTCSNLNDKVFTIGYNAHQTGSNGAVGIKSITIGLAEAGSFGTVDHIKVTALPRTIYHYGEVYDSTGLTVVAYDGADESTANFKDVSASIDTGYTSGIYTFDDADIPTSSMWVSYTESGSTYYADDIVFRVYPVATYELVTDDEPFDWSGEYLIVGAHTVDEVTTYYAMDGSLENPDVDGGHQTVTVNTYTIEAGQELAWKITPVTGGYSIQGSSGKYIGSLAAKNNGMLVSDTPVVNELSLDGVNTTITGTNDYHLKFNPDANGRFRYYSSGTVQLYKLVDSTDAFDFADEFLDMLSSGSEAVCDLDGNTDLDDLKVAWAILAYDYSQLDANDKEQFRLGIANEGGTLVQQALALYDYITEKYGSDLESEDCDNYNFMNRAALSGANPRISPVNGGNSAVTMAIIVVAALTATTAGAYFFLRKKKEEK